MNQVNEKEQRLDEEQIERTQEKRIEALSKLPGWRGVISSKNNIRSLPETAPGQIFWVTMDNKAYIIADKSAKKMTIKALDETATISTGITIFEMNRGIVAKESLFDFNDIAAVDKLKERLWEWFHEDTKDQFYLLYGRDIHYLTLFNVPDRKENEYSIFPQPELSLLRDVLEKVGRIISFDFNTTEGSPSIEIWLRTPEQPAELLYLFPYDKGVVTLGLGN